jgi:TnpA family transposase
VKPDLHTKILTGSLSETQITELFEPPTDQHELIRHYTLSGSDLAVIRCCRGDHNRLGYALMLCYLRFPGRALRAGERPPVPLLRFVAAQIEVFPDCINDYLAKNRNRQRHAIECQEQLGLRPFGRRPAAELGEALRERSRMIALHSWPNW